MIVVPIIGHRNQAPVKTPLVRAALIAPNQQDRLSQGIECERHAPDLALPGKTQFLHVRVPRAFQGIHRGTAQVRPELRQQFGVSQQFVLSYIETRGV